MKRRRQSGRKVQSNHVSTPTCYGSDAPYYYYEVEPQDRSKRLYLTTDICIMDNEYYFIRGCIEVPVIDSCETFIWDVWVSISEENYRKVIQAWDDRERDKTNPYFGWLSTSIPGYPDTLNLKTNIHIREIGVRPVIELEPTNHPLAREQREGISMERIKEIHSLMQ
ncbi:DUF2199 domain-containing protein [Bacillus sp. FDAARGOS_235]|uniref:DUF2199 domain-containing protein n=1 Tax=Bacillus sp. FDAARGOS_235 TaxID=1839798 RepID=UPI0011A89A9F|nr:DUF2199 domain-containing protein [Bacillus sp. FDAARGOS_235]